MNNMIVEGISFPMSTMPIQGNSIRYAKPPTSSLDWMGADWESPTALTFETQTVSAEMIGANVQAGDETEVQHLFYDLRHGLVQMARLAQENGYRIDAGYRIRVQSDLNQIRFRAKVWPTIPGVTTYIEDVTL